VFAKFCRDDNIKGNEMAGGAHSTHGKMRNLCKFQLQNLKREDKFQNLGIECIILKLIFKEYGVE
jgi:hypothetical protein